MRILIVEDQQAMGERLSRGLRELGHNVDLCEDGRQGLLMATTEGYDAIVLDWMLPEVDGLAVLTALRAARVHTPVLMLSARDSVEDKVRGLRAGADDYLPKPFAFEELVARLEVIGQRDRRGEERATSLHARDLSMDLLSRKVTRGEQSIDLNPREFKLLEYLLQHKGQVVTRTMLLEHVWDYHFDPQTNVIDVHISRLRQKVDKGFDVALIETVRGAGYRIAGDG
jgi:two-component system OmpR family response regulator